MEKKQEVKRPREERVEEVPPVYNIKKSIEPGFDLKNCMDDLKVPDTLENLSDTYFDSYCHFGIHEEMLKDRTRTLAYKSAIVRHPYLFKDKIVLDVGCGTGILSIFAAKAGAKHVYGIEYASIATHAQNIIKQNGLDDKITIIRGKVEEIQLPVDKVDIIISEWMGYFLLYESMFDSVIYARDKWLSSGGMLFPDRAIMYVAAIEDEKYKSSMIDFWDNVYDVKMSSIKQWSSFEPLIDVIHRKQIISNSCPILDINLEKVTAKELDFTCSYQVEVKSNTRFSGLAVWFDVYFSHGTEAVRLSTSPYLKSTHWKQTIIYVDESQEVDEGEILKGCIAVKKNPKNNRELDVKVSYHLVHGNKKFDKVQCYRIS